MFDIQKAILDIQFNKQLSIIQLGSQYFAAFLDIHNVSYEYSNIDLLNYINRDRFYGCCFTNFSLFINISISIFGYP